MADNNLDIRARLTGEDRLSPTVVKLLAKIKSLETQMKRFGDKARSAIADIPMEDYVKKLNASGKALNGLTKKHMDWAKANGVATDQAQMKWGLLTNEIKRLQKAHESLASSTKRGNKKRLKDIEDELKLQYKNAVAFRYLYNKSGDDRLNIQRRVHEQLGNLEAAHLRNEEMRHRRHHTNIARMRRDAMRSMGMAAGLGSRAIPYAAVGAAASGYAGASAFRTRMRVDTAETNLRMFGGLSQDQVKDFRKSFGNKAAIKYGMSPDKMIEAYTETIKAGVPEKFAKNVTETIMKSGAGLDLDLKETTRFATRVATLTQDMSNLKPEKLKSILNSVAVAGIETAADPNEIIAANRRASGVFSASKMRVEDLGAFTSAGISAGLPSTKTGTFMGFLVNEIVGGKNARGQRAEDLGKAANLLGLGGRSNMSAMMAANPTETLMRIFEKMGGMNEQNQSKVATLLGMRQWRDELQTMVQVRDDIARTLKAINDPSNANKLDKISEEKLRSLAGRWNQLVSAFTLLWESVGAGFEKAFGQITSFFTDYLGKIDTKKISGTVEAFTDGIVAGLGFNSWTEMLQAAFGNPETVKEYSKEVFGFVKGFVNGLKDLYNDVAFVLSGVKKAMGIASNDPEALGKFTAKLIEFGVALKAIGSLAESLNGLITFVKGLAAVLGLLSLKKAIPLAKKGGSWLAETGIGQKLLPKVGMGWLGMLLMGDGRADNSAGDLNALQEEYKKARKLKELKNYKPSGDPLFQPTSYTGPTDFSGRRRGSDIADNLNKFTGKIERAAFINSGNGGGLQYAFAGGGSGRGLSGSGGGSGGGLGGSIIGGVPSLLKSTPGAALPNFGVGRSGSIIRRDRVGSLTGASKAPGTSIPSGGPADMSVGQGLGGNAFLAARRARFAEELKNDPNLRLHLAAMQMTEGASRGGTIESLMNRTDMQNSSLRKMLGYSADGRINPRSFYGPIRRGELGPAIEKLRRNPKLFAKYDAYTNAALGGSHVIGGYTDQGLPTDPNGSARTGIPGLRLRDPRTGKRDGNEFTDWAGAGRQKAINFRHFLEKGINSSGDSPIGNVPTPTQAIQNVPTPSAIKGDASLGVQRGGGGPVAIHINGSSHDPEALATLVQRRIDESMNWRTHDTSSEYT